MVGVLKLLDVEIRAPRGVLPQPARELGVS